jgi:transcriptional regulator NrdR family protein
MERVNYPRPSCPKCGNDRSWVKNTYYTTDGRIVRHRMCDHCEWKWYSVQYPEQSLDLVQYRLVIPRWGTITERRRKQIKIIPVDNSL